jgi:hypothetical protein
MILADSLGLVSLGRAGGDDLPAGILCARQDGISRERALRASDRGYAPNQRPYEDQAVRVPQRRVSPLVCRDSACS